MKPSEKRAVTKTQIKHIKPAKPLRYPRAVEKSYYRFIKKITVDIARKAINTVIIPAIPSVHRAYKNEIQDSYSDDIHETVQSAKAYYIQQMQSIDIDDEVRRYGEMINANNKKQVERQFKTALGVVPVVAPENFLSPMLDAFVHENTQLIVTISDDIFKSVERKIRKSVTAGMSVSETTKMIMREAGLSKYKAARIARTETGKMFGQLTKQRNLAIGLERFVWHHSGLPNGRQSHIDADGKVFSWKTGGPDGDIPGEAINCRCTSTADFSQLEE